MAVITPRSDKRLATTDTRSRLVLAAAHLVHAESYHAVGVKAICDEAGVQRGSFYHFFESKQALVLEALDVIWEKFAGDVLAVCADTSLTPRERVEAMIDSIYAHQLRDKERTGRVLGCTFANLAAEEATLDEDIRRRLVRIFDLWAEELQVPLAEAQRHDAIDDCAPPRDVAYGIVATLQGLILLAKVNNDPSVVAAGGRIITARLWDCPHGGSKSSDQTRSSP